MALSLLEGNEAVALAAMDAGCRFFAGYPITPATTIYNDLLKRLPPSGGICLQGEDEIASIGYCLGASMAGLKAMTATSGPGISLYSEQLSFAIGSEIPLVIVNVQRLGPSTGSATKGADGDINFMRWGNSGGQPVIVLAPTGVKDAYLLTIEAFNLAETFRCPVFLASNKEIAMTRESIDLDAIQRPPIIERTLAPEGQPYLPFSVSGPESVPAFLPIGGRTLVRQTSSTHGPDGYITTDARVIQQMQLRLQHKLHATIDTYTFYEDLGDPVSETLVVTYGVTARAARTAARALRLNGHPVRLLILKTLWPVPADLIVGIAEKAQRVVVIEMNLGQYVHAIERVLPSRRIDFMGQMDGNLITPEQIEEVITHG
jgi:2-oxoglutarate ferredoxin oxidoreductase subunit alpha